MAKANKPTATTARSTSKSTGKAAGASAPKAASKSTPTTKAAATAPAKAAATAPAKAAAKAPAKAPAKAAAKAKPGAKAAPAKASTQAEQQPSSSSVSRPSTGKVKPAVSGKAAATAPPAAKFTKDGIGYTKDFDVKFLQKMQAQLLEERDELTGQATRLEDEANALVAEAEMGDVQFDDEGGEGDTMVVERERDLALSAQARQLIADIDAALARLKEGTYGYSVLSGRPIPRERLEAIPWADVLVEEKAGGLGRR